jgi:DNA-binding MarR family transcriptional regulator
MGAEVLKPYGITEPQYLALLWISDHEGLIQGDLVLELDSDPNTMSAILRQLDKRKLIERRRHPSDGRAISLFASKQGKELVGLIRPEMDRLTGTLLALLPVGHETAIADWLRSLGQIRKLV